MTSGNRGLIRILGFLLAAALCCLPALADTITANVSGTLATGPDYGFATTPLSGSFNVDAATYAVSGWNVAAGGFFIPLYTYGNGFTFTPLNSTATGTMFGFQFTSNDSQYQLNLNLVGPFAASSTFPMSGSFDTQVATGFGPYPLVTSASLNLNVGTMTTGDAAPDLTPEPASGALLATGALLLMGLAWRRHSYTGV